jgi:hypothetical protein
MIFHISKSENHFGIDQWSAILQAGLHALQSFFGAHCTKVFPSLVTMPSFTYMCKFSSMHRVCNQVRSHDDRNA